ncbi:LTA synthase family protein [Luteimonas sp. RIT-PG2_3]
MSESPDSASPSGVSQKRRTLFFRCAYLLVCVSCWIGYILGAWWVDRWSITVEPWAYWGLHSLLRNSLLGLVVATALTAVTRRALFSILVVAALHALACIASRLKMAILGDPVALQDLYFLTSMDRASIELFSLYIPKLGTTILALLGGISLFVVLFVLERRWVGPTSRVGLVLRGLGGVVSILLLLALYAAIQPWTSIYSERNIRPSPLNLTTAVLRSGLTGSIIYSHLKTSNMTFDVDAAALRRGIELLPAESAAVVGNAGDELLPHVVVVLSESFMDPIGMSGMAGVSDSIPHVRRLMGEGGGGMMAVPTYGGGTVRTEFEVLTGMPVSAFPGAYYPYVSLSRKSIPGLPAVLRANGYGTVAIHGNAGSFWNRTNTYKAMGIDKFITSRQFRGRAKRDGNWYSDHSMTDFILEEIESSSEPRFVVAISIENHGPYTADPEQSGIADPEAWKAIDLPAGLDGSAELELRNYLYHLRNADAEMARLVGRLEQNKRPFVLLFFGDHLPALSHAYGALGFANQESAERQQVPWVIVRDRRLPPVELRPVSESWQLPAELVFRAGLDGGKYFRFSSSVAEAIRRDGAHAAELRAGLDAAANANLTQRLGEYVH